MYKLIPMSGYITVIPLKPAEIKQYTSKVLSDVETSGMDVLQWGKVVAQPDFDPLYQPGYKVGDVVLYPKLASDKTNFGDPRQVIVEVGHVKARISND